jgi:hypothetical protein
VEGRATGGGRLAAAFGSSPELAAVSAPAAFGSSRGGFRWKAMPVVHAIIYKFRPEWPEYLGIEEPQSHVGSNTGQYRSFRAIPAEMLIPFVSVPDDTASTRAAAVRLQSRNVWLMGRVADAWAEMLPDT